MRITGGIYKGRTVKMPAGVLRPAMDRMRESMFAILGSLEDCAFLDLFSGSGIIALEAASRGASELVLVEKDLKKKPVLSQNLLIATNCSTSIQFMTAEKFIKITKQHFDHIHLDPPFPLANKTSLIELIDLHKILKDDGILTIHYPKEDQLPEKIGALSRYDLRTYGRSYLAFYQYPQFKTVAKPLAPAE